MDDVKGFLEFVQNEIDEIQAILSTIDLNIISAQSYLIVTQYAYINYVALYKLLKKFEKTPPYLKIGQDILSTLRFDHSFFIDINHPALIIEFHHLLKHITPATTKTKSTQTFVRSSHKYLALHENSSKLEAFLITMGVGLDEIDNQPLYNSRVTSHYLDNTQFECYINRTTQKDGAFLIRTRQYNGCLPIFLERKTHFVHKDSLKERFILSEDCNNVGDVLANFSNILLDDCESSEEGDLLLRRESREQIIKNQLFPIVSIEYQRTSFQNHHLGLRVTIDRHMTFSRLTPSASEKIAKIEFDFMVVEIKNENPSQPLPDWIEFMIRDNNMISVPNFSKYASAINALFNVDNKLYWSVDILKEQFKKNVTLRNEHRECIYPTPTDPKLILSNESNILKWLSIGLGVYKLSQSSFFIIGNEPPSRMKWWFNSYKNIGLVIFVGYLFYIYRKRSHALLEKTSVLSYKDNYSLWWYVLSIIIPLVGSKLELQKLILKLSFLKQ